jgi:AraC family transcriptional regulator
LGWSIDTTKTAKVKAEVRRSAVLAKTDAIAIYDVTCDTPRSGFTAFEDAPVIELVIPTKGLFVVDTLGRESVADVGSAVVLGAQQEYRVRHPAAHGDACTVLTGQDALMEEALGSVSGSTRRLTTRQLLAAAVFTSSLRASAWDDLEAEEIGLLLLSAAAATPVERPAGSSGARARRAARIEGARALIASSPTTRWRLPALARSVGCSPYHLVREFRAATGQTIGGYIRRLRLAQALDRLAAGEDNLAALALETGFAHHSHLTARFRRAFGVTPSALRGGLTRERMTTLRRVLEPTAS